jgi:hypothetical protein
VTAERTGDGVLASNETTAKTRSETPPPTYDEVEKPSLLKTIITIVNKNKPLFN